MQDWETKLQKGFFFGFVLALLSASMFVIDFHVGRVRALGTIYIKADGSVNPSTAPIQREGDVYTFTDNICTGIVIQRSNIIVDGTGYTLQSPGSGNGFYLSASNVTIKGTNVKGFDWGISQSAGASYNTIFGNNVTSNYGGVGLLWSSANVLRNNSLTGNQYNFIVVGNQLSEFIQDVDTSNTVDGKPIYYCVNCSDTELPSDAGYVALVNSNNITVKNLRLRNNGQGLLLAYTTNAQIMSNELRNNYYGISLLYSSNNSIYSNDIVGNTLCGVFLERSSENRFYHNNFIGNNPYQIYFSVGQSIDTWDNGVEGNSWSDYNGTDSNGDGVGDMPYIVDTSNQDNYPLMSAYMIGDINHDGVVNIVDVVKIAIAYNSNPSSPNWNPHSDLNQDGKINILDLVMVAIHFGEHWTTP